MNKILFTIFLFAYMGSICMAQTISFSRVGSIGRFHEDTYVTSLATSFNASNDCVKLNTGVSLFGTSLGKNDFIAICKPIVSESLIVFKLFPNPVVNYTRLVASGLPLPLQQLDLIIVDVLERIVLKEPLMASILRTGYSLHLSHLSAGNYFLKVLGKEISYVIPFVKVH